LVRVVAASVNHLDIHFRRGLPGIPTPLPHIPGADGAGIVEEIGSRVTGVAVGDRVVLNPGMSCETCEACLSLQKSYCHKYRVIGREGDGTHAEKIVVPAANTIPIPNDITFEIAAAAPLVYLTAWSMVVTKARVKPGMTVLVMSAGSSVSAAAIQIAKIFGAEVIATTSTEEKARKAKTLLHVDHTIVYSNTELDSEIRNLTQKRGVDVVIDHVGGKQWVPLLRSIKNGGVLVTCGATDGFDPKEDLRHIFYRQLRIIGSTMGNDEELRAVMRLVFQKRLEPIIDSVLPLHDAKIAHQKIENRDVFGKIILKP
jgi:NADPH:quinone reductase-like Zn-dependent oxidoreductase